MDIGSILCFLRGKSPVPYLGRRVDSDHLCFYRLLQEKEVTPTRRTVLHTGIDSIRDTLKVIGGVEDQVANFDASPTLGMSPVISMLNPILIVS